MSILFPSEDGWSPLSPGLQALPPIAAAQQVGVAGRLELQSGRLAEEASRLERVFCHGDGPGGGLDNIPGHLTSCQLEVLVVTRHLPRHQAPLLRLLSTDPPPCQDEAGCPEIRVET